MRSGFHADAKKAVVQRRTRRDATAAGGSEDAEIYYVSRSAYAPGAVQSALAKPRKKTNGKEIWRELWPGEDPNKYDEKYDLQQEDAGYDALSPRYRGGHAPAPGQTFIEHLSPRDNVRQQCSALAKALDDYFSTSRDGESETTSPWVIDLPRGGPVQGYELECKKHNDPQSFTRAFWKPHLEAQRPTSLVYVEQLFYIDRPKGLVFRYYDCNEEDQTKAIAELKNRHREIGDDALIESFFPLHPYVARGEIKARDLIVDWFAKYALEEVRPVVTRDLNQDSPTWDNSLILFGSASDNRFIRKVERRYPHLPIQLLNRTAVTIKDVTSEERTRLEEPRAEAHYDLDFTDSACTLSFYPEKGTAPAILTRLPHPDVIHASVTIFNSDIGGAIQQLARVVTEEEWIREAAEHLRRKPPFFPFFQVFCAVSIRSHHRRIYPLVWRRYLPKGI